MINELNSGGIRFAFDNGIVAILYVSLNKNGVSVHITNSGRTSVTKRMHRFGCADVLTDFLSELSRQSYTYKTIY